MSETQVAEATQTQSTTQPTGDDGNRDWKAEFQKLSNDIRVLSRDRDEYKRRLKDLDGIDPEEHKTLKQQAEKAEEERKRKAGEFDSWRGEILKKTEAEKAAIAAERDSARTELEKTLIGLKFAGASALFGETGKTVLTPEIAEAYFSRFVSVEEIDGRKSVVVKDSDGHVILNSKTGKPADFADAMAEVIDAMPNKAHIFRGSGKTGSGSSGGSTSTSTANMDLAGLIAKARTGDKDALKALEQRQQRSGQMVMGRAFQQR
jgi:hypothetical protein